MKAAIDAGADREAHETELRERAQGVLREARRTKGPVNRR